MHPKFAVAKANQGEPLGGNIAESDRELAMEAGTAASVRQDANVSVTR